MEKQISIVEAKSKLTKIIHAAQSGISFTITRYGKPVAVLLSFQKYERLKIRQGEFWKRLKSFRQDMEKENIEITDADFSDLRDAV